MEKEEEEEQEEIEEASTEGPGITEGALTTTTKQQMDQKEQMETSLAKTLTEVIRNVRLLKRFDYLRKKVKENIKNGKRAQNREYASCTKLVKEELISACKNAENEIDEFERKYYYRHNRLPIYKEYPKDITSLVHKRNVAKRLLAHEWNTY